MVLRAGPGQWLVEQGETVYEVSGRLTAGGRRQGRRRGKTDRIDALAVARVVLREDGLPRVVQEDTTSVLHLLVRTREDAVRQATRVRNRLHALLLQIDASYLERLPANLRSRRGAAALEAYQPPTAHPLAQARAVVVRTLAAQLRALLDQERALAAQICQLARPYAALAALPGLGLLGAGMLAAQLGPGQRFRTDAQLAAHAGVAPLEASSGHLRRHRLNREGNRVLNLIFYRIAMTQARDDPRAKAYLARKQAEGHPWREAIRALKRFIARAVFRIWRTCSTPTVGLAT